MKENQTRGVTTVFAIEPTQWYILKDARIMLHPGIPGKMEASFTEEDLTVTHFVSGRQYKLCIGQETQRTIIGQSNEYGSTYFGKQSLTIASHLISAEGLADSQRQDIYDFYKKMEIIEINNPQD